LERRLAAVLMADVVGYSRLMEEDEAGTLAALKERRTSILDPVLRAHGGRIVKLMGDGVLVEFNSAVNAAAGALALQREMAEANEQLPPQRRIVLRIGINLGDVIGEGADIYGEGVNIAARLEAVAQPGGICVSAKVYEEVRGKLDCAFEDIGEQTVKNISRPVRAYRLRPDDAIGRESTRPALSLPEKPSIAVLPFQNMSGDREQDYFSDGIAEDIITALSKLRGFFVIARNSTFAYKGKNVDLRQVARDLGVRYVLEGSVRRASDRLRVTAQLIDAATGAHVWAERYDRSLTDLFALQDEITESVVASIEPQVYAAENLRARGRQTESLDAWGCVIRAMPYVWTWAAEDNKTAVALLERALEVDPSYARASSLLAWAYGARAQLGWSEPSEMLDRALEKARQAIEQDWDDPWAHMAAGYVHMVSRRYKNAVEELTEAIDRNPSFAFAHMLLGSTHAYGGMVDDGLRHVSISMRLSPRDHNQAANYSVTGLCHLLAKRFSEAVVFERRAVQLRPHFTTAWRTLVHRG
jgi:TolB-like protein/Tfp pilus assembly protein PilF